MKKRLAGTILAIFFLLNVCSCDQKTSEGQSVFQVRKIFGDIYLDSREDHTLPIPVAFLSGPDAPAAADLLEHTRTVALEDISGVQVDSFEYVPSTLGSGITYLTLNLILSFPQQPSEDIEITTVQIDTGGDSYVYDIGKIAIHFLEQDQDILSLDSHLGVTLGRGLKRYDVTYRNISGQPVFLKEIDLGAYRGYSPQVSINGEEVSLSSAIDYEILPQETIDIVIRFDSPVTDYDIFLIDPLFTFQYEDEVFHTFSPYATNGTALSDQEIESLFSEVTG